MAPLLVTFAVKEEAYPFQQLAGSRSDLRVLLTGIGQRNAERTIRQAVAEQPPELVLTCGFAGGLNPELAAGTVVFSVDEDRLGTVNPPSSPPREGSQISDARGQFPSPPSRRAIAPLRRDGGWEGSGVGSPAQRLEVQPPLLSSALLAAGAHPASFQCVERVLTTAMEKRALRQQTGADAVEMESGVIRAICGKRNIASATVRVICDAANEDLPLDFNRLMDADQNLNHAKLALALAKSPRKIGALLGLQRQTQAAAENLARVLVTVLASSPLKE